MFPRDKKNGPSQCFARQDGQLGFRIPAWLHNSSKLGEIIRFRGLYGFVPPGPGIAIAAPQKQGPLPSPRSEENSLVRDGGRKAQAVERQLAGGTEKTDADDGLARF